MRKKGPERKCDKSTILDFFFFFFSFSVFRYIQLTRLSILERERKEP
jgi:hypothetical protein